MNILLLKKLSIEEYYLREVYSKGGKFAKGHPYQDRLVLCPLHDDNNPSMGFIKGKDGVQKFHCFGCGRAGTVVDLHKGLHRGLSDEQALKEVCEILGVPYEDVSSEDELAQDVFSDRLRAVRNFNSSLTQAGFSRIIRESKESSKEELNKLLLDALWLIGGDES